MSRTTVGLSSHRCDKGCDAISDGIRQALTTNYAGKRRVFRKFDPLLLPASASFTTKAESESACYLDDRQATLCFAGKFAAVVVLDNSILFF